MSQNELQEQELDQNPDEVQEQEGNQPDAEAMIGILKRENTKLKKQLEQDAEEPQKSINNNQGTDERYERLELKVEGYTDEQIDEIIELGGKKVLSKPHIKKAFELSRKEREAQNAVDVDGSTKSGGASHNYTQAEIAAMSSKEYQEKVINASK